MPAMFAHAFSVLIECDCDRYYLLSALIAIVIFNCPHLLQDLYRWWFRMVCSNGNMRIKPRQWGEVVRDPRYELTYGG